MKIVRQFWLIMLCITVSNIVLANTPDTRVISVMPKEVYSAPLEIKIRLGNGGAGPTGILKALAEDYFNSTHRKISIAWYQDISTNTLRQLKAGNIDIALVYEPAEIKKALEEKWATGGSLIFNDHFIIVGPKSNPAAITAGDDPKKAFLKIADYSKTKLNAGKMLFLSRNDHSGTNEKERSIWLRNNLQPWESAYWYKKLPVFPKDALIQADKEGLYTLTDYGTWLSNLDQIKNSSIYTQGGKELNNPCYGLLSANPSQETKEFYQYLLSERAQKIIAHFGKERFKGFALFTPANQLDFEHWQAQSKGS